MESVMMAVAPGVGVRQGPVGACAPRLESSKAAAVGSWRPSQGMGGARLRTSARLATVMAIAPATVEAPPEAGTKIVKVQRTPKAKRPAPSQESASSTASTDSAVNPDQPLNLSVAEAKERLLAILATIEDGPGARGTTATEQELKEVGQLAAILEEDGGIVNPALSPKIEGRWRLAFLTRPSTASPIQRTFTAVKGFTVYQEINLTDDRSDPRISNIVNFGPILGELRVEASASVSDADEESRRSGKDGKYVVPTQGTARVDFKFDQAAFEFKFLPFKVPYPVPFRLLGDKAKGWLDTTYLSSDLRLSRGNKGSLFILVKDDAPREKLLKAIASGSDVEEAIDNLVPLNPTKNPATSPLLPGEWQQIWSSQAKDANFLQKSFAESRNLNVIGEDGRLENVVELPLGLTLKGGASYSVSSGTRVDVMIDDVRFEWGPLTIPLGVKGAGGYVEQLYLDNTLRVSQGNRGSIFIHKRVSQAD